MLYKYFDPPRISYFKDELLRFTQPGNFNDPFECLPSELTIDEMLKIMDNLKQMKFNEIDGQRISETQKAELRNEFSNMFESEKKKIRNQQENFIQNSYLDSTKKVQDVGILCLTRKWNNPLMWSHYTNSYKGFCIGFDETSDFFQKNNNDNNELKRWFFDVIYSDNRVKIPTTPGEYISYSVMYTKSKHWEYEEEVRLLALLNLLDCEVIRNSLFDIHLCKVPHEIVKEVILGLYIDPDHLAIIKEFCSMKRIPLYKIKTSSFKFELERLELTD